jgi:cytochrome oxidase Cu insertion factor (SCO1/SenC/PrrC family)
MPPNATPPDEPLALTVHSLATPDLAEPAQASERRTRIGRLKMLLVLLVCASPVIASYFTYFVIRPEGRTNYGELISPTRELPATLPLTTLDGAAVAPATLRGQWLLVVVMPSACDAACEKQLLVQRQLREMLGRERDRLDKIVLVADGGALKPELRAALEAAPAATVLRAPREALAQWLAPAAGRALEEHLYVVDPMGQWMMRMPHDAEPQRVMRDVNKLLRASSFWDTPGR